MWRIYNIGVNKRKMFTKKNEPQSVQKREKEVLNMKKFLENLDERMDKSDYNLLMLLALSNINRF